MGADRQQQLARVHHGASSQLAPSMALVYFPTAAGWRGLVNPSSNPSFSHARHGADVVSPSTVAHSKVLSRRRREQQRAGVTGDHQILIAGDHPYRAGTARGGDDLRMLCVLVGVEVNTQIRQSSA